MHPNRYAISLRFWHPSIDPQEITDAMGMAPRRACRAGDPRSTPAGTPLKGINRETYWTSGEIAKGQSGTADLADTLNGLATQLSPHRDFFHRMRAAGGRAELFVGWFFEGNSGDVFDADLLSALGDLGLNLSLDIYPPDQPQSNI